MRFGAHIYVWGERFDDESLAALIEKAASLELAFLEVPVGDDVHFDPSELRQRAERAAVELVLSPGGLWPMHCDISLGDAESRREGLAWHKKAIDLCAQCGAVAYTGAIYGHPGRVLSQPPDREERRRVASGLHELAEHAARHDVRLAIELMSHFRTHVANTPQQIMELVQLADHDSLQVLFDTYHLVTEISSYAEALEIVMPRLWGLHACENNRGAPGTGFLPWSEIADALKRHDWDGYVGLESYNSRCRDGEFAYSHQMFHDVCPDGDGFVRAGKAFLEGLLGSQ